MTDAEKAKHYRDALERMILSPIAADEIELVEAEE